MLNDLKAGADDAIEEKARRLKDLVQWASITLISQQSLIPNTTGSSSALSAGKPCTLMAVPRRWRW